MASRGRTTAALLLQQAARAPQRKGAGRCTPALEPEFMLLKRGATAASRRAMPAIRWTSRATTTRACRAARAFLEKLVECAARRRHRRLSDRSRRRERPVRNELHLRRRADDVPTTSSSSRWRASEIAHELGLICRSCRSRSRTAPAAARTCTSRSATASDEPVRRRQRQARARAVEAGATSSSAGCSRMRRR